VSDAATADPPLTYLDHASTSPLRPEVVEAMAPFYGARFANASGAHRLARDARAALEEAREQVAEVLGAQPSEIVFTSGGTEADNLAVLGTLAAVADDRDTTAVVCSAVEHAAVLAPARAAARRSGGAVRLELAPVDPSGVVDVTRLEELLKAETAVVSIDEATIQDAQAHRGSNRITVRFVSRLISAHRNKAGEIIEGSLDAEVTIVDLWTFARNPASRDPNWKLVATETRH